MQAPPTQRDYTLPTSNPTQSKKLAKKARICLLPYKDSAPSQQKTHGPGNGASCICFLFTMEGLLGCTNRRRKYAHLDGEYLPEDPATKLATLTKTLKASRSNTLRWERQQPADTIVHQGHGAHRTSFMPVFTTSGLLCDSITTARQTV
jgi:hypothetical protein